MGKGITRFRLGLFDSCYVIFMHAHGVIKLLLRDGDYYFKALELLLVQMLQLQNKVRSTDAITNCFTKSIYDGLLRVHSPIAQDKFVLNLRDLV